MYSTSHPCNLQALPVEKGLQVMRNGYRTASLALWGSPQSSEKTFQREANLTTFVVIGALHWLAMLYMSFYCPCRPQVLVGMSILAHVREPKDVSGSLIFTKNHVRW